MSKSVDHLSELAAILQHHQIELPEDQIATLEVYRRTLWQWNEKLNLTRHLSLKKFVERDIIDSLTIEPFLEPGERVLDVGTGGGVPGMVLAIVRPDLSMTLSESVAKRAAAATDIVQAVGIEAKVVHGRAEELLADASFDSLTIRAVARLRKLLLWFEPHWDAIGQVLVIKGPAWVEERKEARQAGLLQHLDLRVLTDYPLVGTNSRSVLLRIRPKH